MNGLILTKCNRTLPFIYLLTI